MPLSDLWGAASSVDSGSGADEDHGNHGHSPSSGSSSGSSSQSHSDKAAELEKYRRRQQTEKARAAALLSRQRKKLEKEKESQHEPDPVAQFQRTYFASKLARKGWWSPFEDGSVLQPSVERRRRAVWVYFTNLASRLKAFFLGQAESSDGEAEHRIEPQRCDFSHVISVNVNDDTNIKLTPAQRKSRSVRSVMANIQHHIVFRHGVPDSDMPSWFLLHQPILVLQRAVASQMLHQFRSWCLHLAGQVGPRMLAWGIPGDIFKHVRRQTFIFVADALKANNTLFRQLSKIMHYRAVERERQELQVRMPPDDVALQMHCNIHQVSLTRRALVLGFEGYWSSLVRLGHLFEAHSFRQRFATSLAKVVSDSFTYVECGEDLPPEAATWRQETIRCLRLHSDDGHAGLRGAKVSKRMRNIWKHMEKDNGNPRAPSIVHWCTGQSCCPGGKEEALAFLIESFTRMFEYTCVPLLYRWKHAAKANNFVRDGFFWHRILPRTLQNLPSVKGHLVCNKFGNMDCCVALLNLLNCEL